MVRHIVAIPQRTDLWRSRLGEQLESNDLKRAFADDSRCLHGREFSKSVPRLASALPEGWRLDPQRPQVDIALSAMVNFVVNPVQHLGQVAAGMLNEEVIRFDRQHPLGGDLRPQLVNLGVAICPRCQQLGFVARGVFGLPFPLASSDAAQRR